MSKPVDLSTSCGPLTFANPVVLASGCCGYGEEFAPFLDLNKLGGICTKGLSWQPRQGNPPPRTVETPAGMLNAIGLENVGIDRFAAEKAPFLRSLECQVIANFFGATAEEYAALARRLDQIEGVDALEINLSCPNLHRGGRSFGQDRDAVVDITRAVREATGKPVIAKLSPNVTDIASVARAAQEGGADAVSLINTLVGMAIDAKARRPVLGNVTGGLSGPAIKPVALAMVFRVSREVGIPVLGMGGIASARDAVEFLLAGAAAVQIGTQALVNPRIGEEIVSELRQWCGAEGIGAIRELIGQLRA